MAYALLQSSVLSLFLLFALWQLAGKLAPGLRRQFQQALALQLLAQSWSPVLGRLGLKMLPRPQLSCASHCSRCGGC